jgi:hypothetical protein
MSFLRVSVSFVMLDVWINVLVFVFLSSRKGKPEQKTEIETQEQTMPLTLEPNHKH